METTERLDRIAEILMAAPAWARLALTSADKRVRSRGADAVSAFLLRRMDEPAQSEDPNQLVLPIAHSG
jgi:hypothetical protein